MYPLIVLIVCLSVFTFFFSNNILPIANMRAGNLLYDIKRHKPELSFKEGVFTNDLEGYSIKIDRIDKNTGMMYNMLIYNHRDVPGNYEVTRFQIQHYGRNKIFIPPFKFITRKLYQH